MPSSVLPVYRELVRAVRDGELIRRATSRDKEFHFQDWFAARLTAASLHFEAERRNTYPDFRLVAHPEGFEVKGLAWPGREANYDSNSQIPSGHHNGREIYYVFGRYPSSSTEPEFPVIDLIICHGDFLNAAHDYVHKNRNIKGFGTYGDLLIRDRKMYVAPTPFALTQGTTGQITLILPSDFDAGANADLVCVGELERIEAANVVVGYQFDLLTNTLTARTSANPNAGVKHSFRAYRLTEQPDSRVEMRESSQVPSIDLDTS